MLCNKELCSTAIHALMLVLVLLSRECVVFLSFKHCQCIRFVGKTGTVTC